MFAKNCLLLFFAAAQKESQSCGNCPQLDSAAVSIFVVRLVELINTVFVNATNIPTNIETAVDKFAIIIKLFDYSNIV